MIAFAPTSRLATHEVTNQPPERGDRNLWRDDKVLRDAALREGGDWLDPLLDALGGEIGREEALAWGEEANQHPPELVLFNRYGRRLDEVRFHPSYHALMATAMRHRIHSIAWRERRPGAHVAHAAMLALFSEVEQGTMCPVSMTYASVGALRHQPDLSAVWLPKILEGTYDPVLRPIADKRGVTLGMAMTEKQGGSDVRANTTQAHALGAGGSYRLVGHKWFCSAPMSDAFLTLARTDAGLSCFLVPRVTPDGERNTLRIQRLKDKLGNRSNASSEIEYHDTYAVMVGGEGRGVQTIIDMVHHTRLDTMAGSLGIMGRALDEARHHVSHRRAFQRTLIDQPAMRAVIADLAIDYEAAAALTMRVARAFDAPDPREAAFARLGVAAGKFQINKRVSTFVCECMECLGGGGYVEEGPMPRLYREAPLNGIWEGSGNVIALDVLRTLGREPLAREAVQAEVAAAVGGDARLDRAAEALLRDLAANGGHEGQARRLAERLALVLQGALLVRHAPAAVADAFCSTRLDGDGGRCFGALPTGLDLEGVLARLTA